jgi:hypothetical protein
MYAISIFVVAIGKSDRQALTRSVEASFSPSAGEIPRENTTIRRDRGTKFKGGAPMRCTRSSTCDSTEVMCWRRLASSLHPYKPFNERDFAGASAAAECASRPIPARVCRKEQKNFLSCGRSAVVPVIFSRNVFSHPAAFNWPSWMVRSWASVETRA